MSFVSDKRENAFVVGVLLPGITPRQLDDQILELSALIDTAGGKVLSQTTQSRKTPDPATYIGKGKLTTIIGQADELQCSLLVFNDDISPTQIKNIQKKAGEKIKVLDRTGLILDIFTKHARTKEAKTQVELAQLEYLLPRLTRQWTHLERQMGGIGTRAGAGETQIEVDRRLIRTQISRLKKQLKGIEKQREVQSHNREKAYRIALVGYTNAGKSTLMKRLTGADVLIQDQLFATLDTTTRKLELNVGGSVLLSDTVGFIRKLPHNLVASFRSTLGEIKNVDILLKVFDASSENVQEHIDTVNQVLSEMEMEEKTELLLFNKIDAIKNEDIIKGLQSRFNEAVFISAAENNGIDTLKERISETITSKFQKDAFHINFNQTKYLDTIYALTKVLKKKSDFEGILLEVEGTAESLDKIRQMLKQ